MCPNKTNSGFILSNTSEVEIARELASKRRKESRYVHLTGKSYLTHEEHERLCYHFMMLRELRASGIIHPRKYQSD